ncbi:MAG TPA: hypothetical protein VG940_11305 [Gemmatimonadales bacterium]|nr:hypothetical protein [Gemmatimonadales bacterium]
MRAIQWWLIAGLVVTAGCADQRDPAALADESQVQPAPGDNGARRSAQERLARRVAKAMRDPEFRAWVRSSLEGSPYREHKLPFARTLGERGGRGVRALAAADSTDDRSVQRDLETADRLEFYFPVPAHRAAWAGDENILVATEVADHEAPVAYDTRGRRHILDPETPPATPVLAVVPQELDFDAATGPQGAVVAPCDTCGVTGGGGGVGTGGTGGGSFSTVPPSLRMTYFSVNKDFEGWLKGSPEYEVHVMAPKSATDTIDYRTLYCIGEHGVRYWNNDNDSWRGDVVLMTAQELDAYHTAFPNNDYSILAVEDDDTSCEIRVDKDIIANFIGAVSRAYADYKGARDTTSSSGGTVKPKKSGWDLIAALIDLIKTNDDVIGIAVANSITGYYSADANWAWIGENATRYGWVKLELR